MSRSVSSTPTTRSVSRLSYKNPTPRLPITNKKPAETQNLSRRNSTETEAKDVDPAIQEIVNKIIKTGDISKIDKSLYPDLISPLSKARRRAVMRQDSVQAKRIDLILSRLKTQPAPAKKAPIPKKQNNSHEVPKTRKNSLSAKDKAVYNKIIDGLLKNRKIDSIDPSSINKLRIVLKERIGVTTALNDYATARKLNKILEDVIEISKKQELYIPRPTPKPEFIQQLIDTYLEEMKIQSRLMRKFEKVLTRFRCQKIHSIASYTEYNGDDLDDFKPSPDLKDLKLLEQQALKEGNKTEAKECAEKYALLDRTERANYDDLCKKHIKKVEDRIKAACNERELEVIAFWEAREANLRENFVPYIEETKTNVSNAIAQLDFYGIPTPIFIDDIEYEFEENELNEFEIDTSFPVEPIPIEEVEKVEFCEIEKEKEEVKEETRDIDTIIRSIVGDAFDIDDSLEKKKEEEKELPQGNNNSQPKEPDPIIEIIEEEEESSDEECLGVDYTSDDAEYSMDEQE